MAEPRARPRHKGQVFSTPDLTDLLYAYSTNTSGGALPSTISCLDEILTDFIIETCHHAALSASYSRRQKIKVDDFKFVLRKDEVLLGRVLEQMWRERRIKEERKVGDFEKLGAEGVGDLEGIAETGGVGAGELKKKRRKKRKAGDEGGEEGRRGKRAAS